MHAQMPTPSPEHRKLHALAGSWTSQETIHPSPWDPNGGPARGRSECRVALDGFFVVCDYEQERDGRVAYRGHGVYGYDAPSRRWSMQWSDNMGGVPSPIVWGTWEGDVLTFQMAGPQGGFNRYVYRFEKDGAYRFEIGHSRDGATWSNFMEGRFTRSGS
jgi:hypothetical protein